MNKILAVLISFISGLFILVFVGLIVASIPGLGHNVGGFGSAVNNSGLFLTIIITAVIVVFLYRSLLKNL